jgi:hypothetical protein
MRCLYCGKELALLKRLTKGGEFCSDAHKQSYQEEYNRLGLSRLLQARTSAAESKAAQKAPPVPAAPVAVAEPAVEKIAVVKVTPPPRPAPPPVVAAPPEPPPPAFAGFVMERPSISVPAEPVSDLEPWRFDDEPAGAPFPSLPAWGLEGLSGQDPFFTLPSAGLLPLELQAGVCESGYPSMDINVAPQEVSHPRVNLSMPLTVASSHEFQAGGSVAIEIAPRPSESSCYASLNGALDFSYSVGVQVVELLELPSAGIAYPAEDCDVTVAESWTNGFVDAPVDILILAIPQEAPSSEVPVEPANVPTSAATPRAALEALSKLHQDMRDREEAKPPGPPAAPAVEATLEVTEAAPESTAKPTEEPTEPAPREAGEMLAISLKSFAPPKANPVIDANVLLSHGHPLLPRLKALPLRPKVAPAPRGFSPQPKTAAVQNPPAAPKAKTAPSSPPARAEAPQKPPVAEKPAQPAQASKAAPTAEVPKPLQPSPAKKTAQPVEAPKAKQPAPLTQTVQPAQSQPQPKQEQPKQEQPKQEQPAKTVPVKSAPAPAKLQPAQPQTPQSQKAEPAAATIASSPVKSEPVQNVPAAKKDAVATAQPTYHTVPNFGVAVNTSMFGSLKVKVGLASLIAVLSIGAYIVASGKSKTAYPVKASDAAGPSIMVGEGGWVEGWAGDPSGLHNARQITIYRPSLKLADYRFEFQGQIENKSIGWIFRAADPENYYAMKLQLVSQELPLKLELYKYLVLKGRQVQAGRVPIDVPVKNDTVFSIRLDVRGPKFNTYVQGQPVDVWTDDQLRSGGVGFLNERSERGKVKSVSLSYLSGGTK